MGKRVLVTEASGRPTRERVVDVGVCVCGRAYVAIVACSCGTPKHARWSMAQHTEATYEMM